MTESRMLKKQIQCKGLRDRVFSKEELDITEIVKVCEKQCIVRTMRTSHDLKTTEANSEDCPLFQTTVKRNPAFEKDNQDILI